MSPSELVATGSYGLFLNGTPTEWPDAGDPARVVRHHTTERFDARPIRIKARSRSDRGGMVHMSLHSAPPLVGASFTYPCDGEQPETMHGRVFTRGGHGRPVHVDLRYGSRTIRLQLPGTNHQLLRWQAPLADAFCDGETPGRIDIAAVVPETDATGPVDILMSPPLLTAPADDFGNPVILISVDTLRRDSWDERSRRSEALSAFYADAHRFSRAFSSFPTTPESHSVLFSGLFPTEISERAVDASLSFVPALRSAGYLTLGFVAGGFMRSSFGFGGRAPGFSLGFDLYLEDMRTHPKQRLQHGRRVRNALVAERGIETHTLAPGLERSLRWFRDRPSLRAFHFIHGYDVHDYRSVSRPYWDRAIATHVRGGGDREAIDTCAKRVGMQQNADFVVHFRMASRARGNLTGKLGELEDCHRQLSEILYEARVLTAEEMLARYFEGLRTMGIYDRALIIVTSDHGESLLDEIGWSGQNEWGHNRVLANNLAIPLWIKRPGSSGDGRTIDTVVGLVDLRATLAAELDLDITGERGMHILADDAQRTSLIQVSSGEDGYGLILAGGEICAWKSSGENQQESSRLFIHGAWRTSELARTTCATARQSAKAGMGTVALPPIPEALKDELRALGYVE